MTREEAIELIESARKTMYLPKSKEYISDFGYALEMAIEALEQSSYNSIKTELKGDMISRQSAIFLASDLKQDLPDDEHLTDMVMAHNEGVSEYQTQLSLLPPVNPQNCDKCEVGNPCLYCKHEFEPLYDDCEEYKAESEE